jgi:hypothetical protein
MAELTLEDFKTYLPPYLTSQGKEDLYKRLKDFPANRQVYAEHSDVLNIESPLQGDAWKGFIAINFHTLEKKGVSGIILSNSCDISPENVRDLPVNVLFAPLLNLHHYAELLKQKAGRQQQDVDSILDSIRNQKTTSIFHLPPLPGANDEHMVLLDDIRSEPLAAFFATERSRLFRLNMYGFYLLLFKMSLHLMRVQEGIDRH